MPAEELLRERLSSLAAAAGLPVPPLEIEPDPRGRILPARVDWSDAEDRVVISSTLLTASPQEQTWHLAACLGWWASTGPRRTRNRDRLVAGLVFLLYVAVGLVDLLDIIDLPKLAFFLLGTTLGGLLTTTLSRTTRRQAMALDAAGRSVLRAAGHDPATLARLVFGDQADPPWYRRPWMNEPPPSRRLRAAGTQDVSPARPLF